MRAVDSKAAHEFARQVVIPEIEVISYKYSDLDATAHTLTIPIDPDTVVVKVGHEVVKAFSGGTPSIDIGDGTTAAYFLGSASITEGAAGNLAFGTASKKYATGGVIVVTHAAGLTAGEGKVFIEKFSTKGNWRQPNL